MQTTVDKWSDAFQMALERSLQTPAVNVHQRELGGE